MKIYTVLDSVWTVQKDQESTLTSTPAREEKEELETAFRRNIEISKYRSIDDEEEQEWTNESLGNMRIKFMLDSDDNVKVVIFIYTYNVKANFN